MARAKRVVEGTDRQCGVGATTLPAQVINRIAPSVVSIKEGDRFTPGADGTDTQGCANVLTTDRAAPCDATTYNASEAQIEAVQDRV